MSPNDSDIFKDAIGRLDRAVQYADVDQEVVERLKHPKQILEVSGHLVTQMSEVRERLRLLRE